MASPSSHRRVRFATTDDGENTDDDDDVRSNSTPIGWTPMASIDDAATPTPTTTTTTRSNSSGRKSSAMLARIATWETTSSASETSKTTIRESGASAAAAATTGSSGAGGRRLSSDADAEDVKMQLFHATSSPADDGDGGGYRDVLERARAATRRDGGVGAARAAVERVMDTEAEARERRHRVARAARHSLERASVQHSSVMASFAVKLRELTRAAARLPSTPSQTSARRRDARTPQRGGSGSKLFLTGATPASSSKHVNYSGASVSSAASKTSSVGEPTLSFAQRERMKIERVDVPALLRRCAFAALRHNADMARARRRAASELYLSHQLPAVRRAFDALQAHADVGKPRRDAVRAACASFRNIMSRRLKRACARAWRAVAREGNIERTCGAIHNIRVAEAALRHWELFATARYWKRQSNALAQRYASRRRKTMAFYGWARDVRRAKERRIAVRAKLFGMSVVDARRAVHAELRHSANDATVKMKHEIAFVYNECAESAARARVASSKTLTSHLRGGLRFTATERDVVWASSGAGDILGLGASFKNLALGFDVACGVTRGKTFAAARDEALTRARGDAMSSRLAADIEGDDDEDGDEEPQRVDIDVASAYAYELAREHQIALKNARDAAQKCTAARTTAHETVLNASRLIANAESRANAAIQGADDAMSDSVNAEYRAIEAEETAQVAEKRADQLSELWGAADDGALAEALRHAADAATRSLTFSSAHAAAAKVAERAAQIAEDHKEAAEFIKLQAEDDIKIARERVIEAEAAVLETAQAERQLKAKATEAMRRLSAVREQTSGEVINKRHASENIVYSPKTMRKVEEKEAMRQRLTWASYGVGDDDDDEEIDVVKVSMKPGAWHTLNDVAVQVYARRLASKALRGFMDNVRWCAKQREAAQLAFVTDIFNAWADTAHVIQARRKRIEKVVDEVINEDRERRMRLYLRCFQKHANWRRARCEELAVSLRRVMIATTRDAFDLWRVKVYRFNLCRRVINRGVFAWRERLAKPSHVGAFHRLYDSLCEWRRVARAVRERSDKTNTAREYHTVTLTLKCVRAWRKSAHERRRVRYARRREFDDFLDERRRRVQTLVLIAWRRQALKRRARILAIELYYRRLARRVMLHWRRVVTLRGATRRHPRLALAPLAEAVVSRNSRWRRLPTT